MSKQQRRKAQRPVKPSDSVSEKAADGEHSETALDETLAAVPEETRIAYVQAASFKGPLPPPILFEHYDQVLPGSAERILQLTEKEQSHRQQWETSVLDAQKSDIRRGQWMGFGLGVCGIVAALVCAFLDRPYIGVASLATVIAGIATSILSKRQSNPED